MKAVVISYTGGMFGEFFTHLLSESDSRFVNIHKTQITTENRFLYPNYLSPINLDVKNYPPNQSWNISQENNDILHNQYGDKWICIPTHWHDKTLENTGLPSIGIRLYCDNIIDFNLSYCLWWLKSHIFANTPWPLRVAEINNMIQNNHTYKLELENLLKDNNYSNWKFLSYKENILKNRNLDFEYYLKGKYFRLFNSRNLYQKLPGWITLDIGKLVNDSSTYDQQIESKLQLENSLNIDKINLYKEQNLNLIKKCLNLNYEELNGHKWLDNLYQYCSSVIEQHNIQ